MAFRTWRLAALLALLGASPLAAQTLELTPHYGYRVGGGFDNFYTGESINLRDSESFGFSLNYDLDVLGETQLEFVWSQQETEVDVRGLLEQQLLDVDVDYFHVGALRHFGLDDDVRPFLVGTIGATHFSPKGEDISSDTRFSLAIGGGVKFMAGERVGIRLQARAFATYVDSSAAIGCGPGGCIFGFGGNVVWQGDFTAGVILRFGE
jgi:opacity protein-like surface antigen